MEVNFYLYLACLLVASCLWLLALHVLEGPRKTTVRSITAGLYVVGGFLVLAVSVFELQILQLSRATSLILGCGAVAVGMWMTQLLKAERDGYFLCSSLALDRATLAALGAFTGAPGVVLLSHTQIRQARQGGCRITVVGGPYDSYESAEADLDEHWEFSHEYERTMRSLMAAPGSKDSK